MEKSTDPNCATSSVPVGKPTWSLNLVIPPDSGYIARLNISFRCWWYGAFVTGEDRLRVAGVAVQFLGFPLRTCTLLINIQYCKFTQYGLREHTIYRKWFVHTHEIIPFSWFGFHSRQVLNSNHFQDSFWKLLDRNRSELLDYDLLVPSSAFSPW